MENSEKYYRRAYNAIQKLTSAYKDGYTPKVMSEFRNNLLLEGVNRQRVFKEEQLSLMFLCACALLGLNKESIEKTEKISEYASPKKSIGIEREGLSELQRKSLTDFNSRRIKSTPFDSWLSITKDLTSENDEMSIIRKIRNGILHGNFEFILEPYDLDYTNIKIKSYFTAELLNIEFEKYIFEYFSNLEGLGLTEKMFTYNIRLVDIKNKDILHTILQELSINKLSYKNLKSLGDKTPEDHLMEARQAGDWIDVNQFLMNIATSENFDGVTSERFKLSDKAIHSIENYLGLAFKDDFYKLPSQEQTGIISTYLSFLLNPKREVSNWLTHFWYLYSTLTSKLFNPTFFTGDEYGFESCYPALLILKSYLVMYRLQNKSFDSIDYKKIKLPPDGSVLIYSEKVSDSADSEDTYEQSVNQELRKNPELTYIEAFNKVICEVVRNSLAHGNVDITVSPTTLERKIDLTDVDPKTKKVRKISFMVESFNEFLNSEAFLPKNCYGKSALPTKSVVKEL